ncbi:MAG: aldo/keto reductase [Bacteroidetes bacterium]|nr:aldo/keto reductase [Bacteroidota bacterium]
MLINKIVLGTVQFGLDYGINNKNGKPKNEEINKILELAYLNGINTLDTSVAYGDSIKIIGNYHKQFANKYKIINKFFIDEVSIIEKANNELLDCNVDNFEAYLFHNFSDFKCVNPNTIKKLEHLKDTKKINKIGISVYTNEQFSDAIKSNLIDVIQFPYNLLDNSNQRAELIIESKANNKELHIRSVFLQGLFFMPSNKLPYKINSFKKYLDCLNEIAKKNNISIEYLALNYVLKNKNIDKVLIGVDSLHQLQNNLTILNSIQKDNLNFSDEIDKIKVKEVELLNPVNWN